MNNISLDKIKMFSRLGKVQISSVKKILRSVSCRAGDSIFIEGEYCQKIIIIGKGSFLEREKDGGEIVERILLEGDVFDFSQILSSCICSKSLLAVEDSEIITIEILNLKRILERDPILKALVLESLDPGEKVALERFLLNIGGGPYSSSIKIRSRIFPIIFQSAVIACFGAGMEIISSLFFKGSIVLFIFLAFGFVYFIFKFIENYLSFIEVDNQNITRKKCSLIKGVIEEEAITWDMVSRIEIEKVKGFPVKNNLYICTEQGGIEMENVYKCDKYKNFFIEALGLKKKIAKGIELASFKEVYGKKNGLFHFNNTEDYFQGERKIFRDALLFPVIDGLPFWVIVAVLSLVLYFTTNNIKFIFFNFLPLLYSAFSIFKWKKQYYEFKWDKIIFPDKRELPFGKIKNIKKVQKNFVEIILNFGDIIFEINETDIEIKRISKPKEILEYVHILKQYYFYKNKSLEKIKSQEEFLDFSGYLKEIMNEKI